MANNVTDNIAESFQNIFLAGVGALSIGGEKAKVVLDDLVARGQVTVEQGRKINEELKHKAADGTSKFHEDSVRAYVKSLSPEDRSKFAESMAALAKEIDEEESDEVVVEAEEAANAAE
jgi:polyhydroxyalkanoate synthesis regulator phasin